MTTTSELLADSFERVREEVAAVLDGASDSILLWRPDPQANTIAWLIWHLTRVQDDHLAAAFGRPQVWHEEGWIDRFALPFPPDAHGYGHTSDEVGQVRAGAELLGAYHEAVARRSAEWVAEVRDDDLSRVVDDRWDPPVTMGVRLVSVISDELQHVGQAAYVRGLAERSGAT